jgi:hypothetical protein
VCVGDFIELRIGDDVGRRVGMGRRFFSKRVVTGHNRVEAVSTGHKNDYRAG